MSVLLETRGKVRRKNVKSNKRSMPPLARSLFEENAGGRMFEIAIFSLFAISFHEESTDYVLFIPR